MIQAILDDDMYKDSMAQVWVREFPRAYAVWKLINRSGTKWPTGFGQELRRLLDKLGDLRMTDGETQFLASHRWFKPPYVDFRSGYRYDPKQVEIVGNADEIYVKGPYYRNTFWEIPILSTVQELYYIMTDQKPVPGWEEKQIRMAKRFRELGIRYAEFGTRRRASFEVQDLAVEIHKDYGGDCFIGTSNMLLAMKHKVKAIGTMAHEGYSAMAATYGYLMANTMMMEAWIRTYEGDLGIVLPDTFTTDVFLRSFDRKYARLFDGGRQDSGDPIEFIDKWENHYRTLGINPKGKSVVPSNSLDDVETERIFLARKDVIPLSFGIGRFISNNCGMKGADNIVMKLVGFTPDSDVYPMRDAVKLSDDPGKSTGNPDEVRICRETLKV